MTLHKYPRTHHLESSRRQPGDEDLDCVPFATLRGCHLVVEEKVDGANCALSFGADGGLRLQSRGHFLTGGTRERHFDLFKAWTACHQTRLFRVLGSRYIIYGEWLYAKHTIFYDTLPHYFLEFDVLDTEGGTFLSTERRRALLARLPIVSVPVLWEGQVPSLDQPQAMIGPSRFKSAQWRERLRASCSSLRLDTELTVHQTDPSDTMEGLYVKVEEDGQVIGRYKLIRASFLTTVVESGSHWLHRPIVPNQLEEGVDIFGDGL